MARPTTWSVPIQYRWLAQLATGVELALTADVFQAAFVGRPLILVSEFPAEWEFAVVTYSALGIGFAYLAGLMADLFYTELVRQHLRDEEGNLRKWYLRVTQCPERGWQKAREWMWTSEGAHEEFGRLQFAVALCRNTALNFGIVIVLAVIGLVYTVGELTATGDLHPRLWWFFAAEGVGIGGAVCMYYFWLESIRSYHALVREAGSIGSPPMLRQDWRPGPGSL